MAPPTKPSDSHATAKPEAQKPDDALNLLNIVDGVKKNALAPAANSFLVEPTNVAVNVANGVLKGGAWLVNKVAKTSYAPELPKAGEFEVGKPDKGGLGFYSQQIFGTAGSFLAYAVAGKMAGRVMRTAGELAPLEWEIKNLRVGSGARAFAQDTRIASVVGATAYAGLKDPKDGESRFSNAASTLIGFSTFEIGNAHLISPNAPVAFRLGERFFVGNLGGAAQTNVASLIQQHTFADKDSTLSGGLGGGFLNLLVPRGRVAIESIAEGRVLKGLPNIPEAAARLHADAARQVPFGQTPEAGSWADPKVVSAVNKAARGDLFTRIKLSDEGPTRIDQKKNVVYRSEGDHPLNVIQELAHRRVFRDAKFNDQFEANAKNLHSDDPSDPRNAAAIDKYVDIRVNQEIAARTEQNDAAVKIKSPKRVSVDAHEIRDVEGYGARFEVEAHDFVRSGGKTRPTVDHAAGPIVRLAAEELAGRKLNDNVEPVKPPDLNIVGGTDTLDPIGSLRIERARVDRWEAYSRDIIRTNSSAQDKPQNNLYDVLKERLIATGLASEGWTILPTQTGSPLDQVGCDFALVNKRTTQVIFLDATQNAEKLANPAGKNVSQFRMDGLIGFDNKLIDIGGRLKTDEPGRTGQNARNLQDDIDHRLRALADLGSPVTSDMLPSFWKQNTPLESQSQVDTFRLALQKKAATMPLDSRDRGNLEDYARDLGRGASRHNELAAATIDSQPLTDAVSRNADRVVLDYVLGKMRIKEVAPTSNGSPNVKIHKDGHILISVEGTIYDGGNVQQAVAEARLGLRVDSNKLTTLLQRDKSVLRLMQRDHLTIDQMTRRVQEALLESREIDNGMLGSNDLGLSATIRNRISNNRPEDLVTGRVDQPKEKVAKSDARASVFSAEQQAEIPKIAQSMSEFNLKVQDGVDPQDLKAFMEMYRDETQSDAARQLCEQYLADVDKPVGEQRLIPKLHGALVAAQMRSDNQLAFAAAAGEAVKVGGDGSSKAIKVEKPDLPLDQVKLALDRLKELQAMPNPSEEELRQIEALRDFQAHVLDQPTRSAVASNLRKMGVTSEAVGLTMSSLVLAVGQWWESKKRIKGLEGTARDETG